MAQGVTKNLLNRAQRHLVGGVNSPVRAFNYVGEEPLLIKRGRGCRVYDYDGKEYIDYVLSWGSLILGHAFPSVINAVSKAARSGLSFGATNQREIELAEMIKTAVPFVDKLRFVSSGTEAVMGAIRLARGCTGRDKILKFNNSYHGHADYLLASAGSGLATFGIPQSKGVPLDFIRHTLISPYGDIERLERVFRKYGKDIAAVIVEPAGANYGVVVPDIAFLKSARSLTRKYGVLLIFDEVITGFRFHFGALASISGLTPDLVCLGKIIGGGLPVGAYGGGRRIMRNLAPEGRVYQASTFAGNPVVMAAGIATLKTLSALRRGYKGLELLTARLTDGIKREGVSRDIDFEISRFGAMFSFKFKRKGDFEKFYGAMRKLGVFFAPSEFEANFLSFSHTRKDVDKTLAKAREALWKI
ncbi:MAG: glutamate-1-semialdehyde 2,1-aminomutase [Candidatus Omnitrophica bacterium]|nr:glutamate-1-semialdehyde 2,1-aminomutase [Candidatus Omnitrophota bacterium]